MPNTVSLVSYNKNQPVDELPANVDEKICAILNEQNKWKELAGK